MQWVCGAGRVLACRIVLLDEREQVHEVQANKSGQILLDAVFRQLDLVETSYFGLRYLDQDNQPRWLEPRRRLSRQLRGAGPHTLYLAVKYYAADPCRLLEEITRYQVFLQVRQDVVRGRLPVPPDLAPQLAAYVLQSELGDYDPRRHPAGYVSEFRLQPAQTTALEARAAELHRSLAGQSPAAAELGFLDRAKWLELYGADLHPVLGEDSVEYFLGLAPSGVLVLRNKRAVASYYWPRITKLYSKGKYFMLRVTDKNNEVSTYGFETPSRGACRHLWRCCSEQHAFFRLQPAPQHNRSIRQGGRSPPAFTRVPSRRLQRRPLDSNQVSTVEVRDSQDLKPISIPQPALSLESPYRSTCSIPAALGSMRRSDSPRSTRSAPFPRPPPRQGLYSGPPSPRTATGAASQTSTRLRSSSIDSHSSNDSRSCRRHRQRSRRTSDAESEVSRGSGRSRRRRRHRSRHKGKDSADETDSKNRSSSRRKEYELVESGGQWKEVQRKQAVGGTGGVQQASVRRAATTAEASDPTQAQHRSSHRHRRHRKHRSRSRSPSESKSWLPTELKQHLEWELVDTEGMSADQLREIPYTVVQTSRARQLRLKSGVKHRSGENPNDNDDQTKNYSNKSNIADVMNSNGGSIRSVSSTISSGRNSNTKISERRLKDLTGKDLSPSVAEGVGGRGVRTMGMPEAGGGTRPVASASNSSSGELIASARVSHEHTDSGLGADQDYAYSSERSSDSAKCPAAGGLRQQQISTPSVSSLRPSAPYSIPHHYPTPHSLSADLAALSLTRRKPPINPAVNKHYVQPSNTSGMAYKEWGTGGARLGRGRAGGSLRSLASVQSEGRATLNKHRGPLYFVRGDAAYAFNRHASNNNFVDSGIFLTSHRQNGGSLRGSSSHQADFYNMNRSTNPGHLTLNRYTDANANVKRHGGHATDNSLHIILKPLIESTQLQGN